MMVERGGKAAIGWRLDRLSYTPDGFLIKVKSTVDAQSRQSRA